MLRIQVYSADDAEDEPTATIFAMVLAFVVLERRALRAQLAIIAMSSAIIIAIIVIA